MGESRDAAELAAKFAAAGAGIKWANRRAVSESSLVVKTAVQTKMVAATGGDLVLSGLSRGAANTSPTAAGKPRSSKSGKIGVRYDLKGTENVTSLVRAFGPAHLVENDTKKHDIKPRGRGRRRGASALAFPGAGRNGSGFAAGAKQTGGSKGKHPWRDGVAAARPLVAAQFRKSQLAELAKRFGP